MYGVTDLSGLEFLERENKIVLVLLSSTLYPSTIDWMCHAWDEVHHRSAHRWHMVVPTKKPINGKDHKLKTKNFSWKVSETLRNTYGISKANIPCIVLDNFRDDQRQHFVVLPEIEKDRAKLILGIEDFIKENENESREELINALFDRLKFNEALAGFIKVAPIAGSIVSKIVRSSAV